MAAPVKAMLPDSPALRANLAKGVRGSLEEGELEIQAEHRITVGAEPPLGDNRPLLFDTGYPDHFGVAVTDRALRGVRLFHVRYGLAMLLPTTAAAFQNFGFFCFEPPVPKQAGFARL
jgi:hypothetical protein